MRAWAIRERAGRMFGNLVLEPIRDAIRQQQGCESLFAETWLVPELEGHDAGGAAVHGFRLLGHRQSARAFTWLDAKRPGVTIVLPSPTVLSALDAVLAVIELRREVTR